MDVKLSVLRPLLARYLVCYETAIKYGRAQAHTALSTLVLVQRYLGVPLLDNLERLFTWLSDSLRRANPEAFRLLGLPIMRLAKGLKSRSMLLGRLQGRSLVFLVNDLWSGNCSHRPLVPQAAST